mmetsp:Transcript_11747/g.22554  ORF Transcript_11747/g.22554 Transcript_11747/m.22554 type:complete len:108 (+) Transcript_11747:1259-1582(+)
MDGRMDRLIDIGGKGKNLEKESCARVKGLKGKEDGGLKGKEDGGFTAKQRLLRLHVFNDSFLWMIAVDRGSSHMDGSIIVAQDVDRASNRRPTQDEMVLLRGAMNRR